VLTPNLGFENGAAGWSGNTECIVAYTDPAPAIPAAALASLRQLGGSYWRNLPASISLPVQGLRYVDTSVVGGTARLTSQPFVLLAPGEADPFAAPAPIRLDRIDKISAIGGLRRDVPPPLSLQFLRQSLNGATDGSLSVEFQVRPRNDAQKQFLEKLMHFELNTGRPLPGQPTGGKTTQVADWLPVTDGSGFYRRVGGKYTDRGGALQRIVWDIAALRGMEGRILIGDESTATGLFVDDFRLAAGTTPLPVPNFVAPVWGFADLHAHPAAHLGFGGKLYHGLPEGAIGTALGDCEADHGFKGSGLSGGQIPVTIFQALNVLGIFLDRADLSSLIAGKLQTPANMEAAIDGLNGITDGTISRIATLALAPHFHTTEGIDSGAPGWYSHEDQLHQHMYVDYVRRVWQGGLRLMVALAVNTELLGNMNPKPGFPTQDRQSVDLQLQYIKDMATRNASWMEVAYTPADARRIIGQNKLALVMGVEVDTPGGFATEAGCTDAQVEQELNRLRAMGARHFFPIHLADNAFGGAAFYNDLFLLNHLSLRGARQGIIPGDGSVQYKPFEGIHSLIEPNLLNVAAARLEKNNRAAFTLVGGMRVPFAEAFRFIESRRSDNLQATLLGGVNRLGLTGRGQFAIQKMMDMGLIIDIDHMSGLATEATLGMAEARTVSGVSGYPLVSGHSHFRSLAWKRGETSDLHKLPNELDKPDAYVDRLNRLGGMVAPITGVQDVRSHGTLVANDAPGTSKSWAQAYLYGSDKMGRQRIGLATDMAMYGGLGPRFGPRSLPSIAEDLIRAQRLGQPTASQGRRLLQAAQGGAVSYTSSLSDWKTWRWDGEGWSEPERNALLAALLARTGPANLASIENQLQPARGIIDTITGEAASLVGLDKDRKRVLNMAIGLRANAPIGYVADAFFNLTVVQNAAFDARNALGSRTSYPDLERTYLPGWNALKARFAVLTDADKAIYKECFNAVSVALATLNRMPVNNSPSSLTRPVFGGRQFDFNLDGLAHYGLLPDFLQDLSNNGANPTALAPLFRSAEDYIRLWEKCEKLRKP
jgi:microsomal dipeptidase-like Zn-dependent dipeptidase